MSSSTEWVHRFWKLFLLFFGSLLLLSLVGDFFPTEASRVLESPSWTDPFGRDSLGRSMFIRIVQGSSMTVAVGLLAALVSLLLGAAIGVVSGFFGGVVDIVIQRMTEVVTALPSFVFVGLILFLSSSAFEEIWSTSLGAVLIVGTSIGISSWPPVCRLTRALVLREKQLAYVESEKAYGTAPWKILMNHVFPNILPAILVSVSNQIPQMMMFEGFLSFVGLGLKSPLNSWGLLLREGWRFLASHPHMLFGPALVIVLILYGVQRGLKR